MKSTEITAILEGTGIFAAFSGEDCNRLINIYNSLEIIAINKEQNLWRVDDSMPSGNASSPVAGIMATLEECVKFVGMTFDPESPITYRKTEDSIDYGKKRLLELNQFIENKIKDKRVDELVNVAKKRFEDADIEWTDILRDRVYYNILGEYDHNGYETAKVYAETAPLSKEKTA